jgi:hypothetical protein
VKKEALPIQMSTEPSMPQWQILYDLAQAFRETGPWQWMSEDDLFGVQDPDTGEVGYCSVIGELGEAHGLAIYPGSEGLVSYAMMKEIEDPLDPALISRQRTLSLIFANRDELSSKDKALIKELGIKFRGKNAWPVFRSMKPWYYPWYLTADEAEFFIVVLQQALEFCLEYRQNPYIMEAPQEDRILVKVKEGENWQYQWQELPSPQGIELPVLIPTDIAVKRIKQECRKATAKWETGFFPFPAPVKDKGDERPYYPVVTLWVDQVSGLILHFEIFKPGEWHRVADSFISTALLTRSLPARIYTSQPEVRILLQAVAEKLGITLRPTKELKALETAKESMIRDLAGRSL